LRLLGENRRGNILGGAGRTYAQASPCWEEFSMHFRSAPEKINELA
jgi:hypothetical protein